MGADRFMWGSDYPHDEGTYPFTREHLRQMFHDVDEPTMRDILAGNAAKLYDFDLDALAPVAERIGPTVEELAEPLEELPENANLALVRGTTRPEVLSGSARPPMAKVTLEKVEPRIALITLNRPDRLNALDYELVSELHDALDAPASDEECRVGILTGAGRGFCAGLDLKDFGTPPGPAEHPHARVGVGGQEFMANLTVHMRNTPQILIGAVNGAAFGGGLSLACATDVRFAAESARFCSAFIRTGMTGTDIGITYLLPRLIGSVAGVRHDRDRPRGRRERGREDGDRLPRDRRRGAHGLGARDGPDRRRIHEDGSHPHQRGDVAQPRHRQHRGGDRDGEPQPGPRGRAPDVREFMAAYSRRVTGEAQG